MTEDKDTNGQQDTVKAPDNTTAKKGNGDKKTIAASCLPYLAVF